MSRFLVIGSGPGADLWARTNAPFDGFAVCPINNAWSVVGVRRTDTWFRSLDFYVRASVQPVGSDRAALEAKCVTRGVDTPFNYNQEDARGTMIFGVLAHLLNTGRDGDVVAVACCDMVYEGEDTHFYGRGSPDPLRYREYLGVWLERTVEAYAEKGRSLFNVGPAVEGTRLPLPRATLRELTEA